MPGLKFISNGTTMHGRAYDLVLNGKRIGYAYAKVTQNATGLHKIRGTHYEATITALDNQTFGGSRATITRAIERALATCDAAK